MKIAHFLFNEANFSPHFVFLEPGYIEWYSERWTIFAFPDSVLRDISSIFHSQHRRAATRGVPRTRQVCEGYEQILVQTLHIKGRR